MWGNSHVPFLGGWGAARLLRLPDHIQRRPKLSEPERKVLYVTPTEKSVERYKEKIRDLLAEPNINVVNKLQAVNRVIRGWARYYRYFVDTANLII